MYEEGEIIFDTEYWGGKGTSGVTVQGRERDGTEGDI